MRQRRRVNLWLAGALACFVALCVLFVRVTRKPLYIDAEEVWKAVAFEAAKHEIDPRFVYAVLFAESSLNAHADTGIARGIMQLTAGSWEMVSKEPYEEAWNWRKNIAAGVSFLAYCRERLEEAEQFSYALLAASYRFGPGYVENLGYDIEEVKRPRNRIYMKLFAGEIAPVDVPTE